MIEQEITPLLRSREHDVLRAAIVDLIGLQREFEEARVQAILRAA